MTLSHCLLAAALVLAAPAGAQTTAAVKPEGKSVWVTLGTGGGPQIRRERSEPANALVVNGATYLFDVGSGTERQMVGARLPLRNVKAIFVSHHHIDHDADLGQLISSRWMFNSYAPLPIVGPPGTVDMVKALVSADRPVELAPIGGGGGGQGKPSIGATVAPRDMALTLDTPAEVYKDVNIRVLAVTNTHYHFAPGSPNAQLARSYSFRIETPGRTFLYTGDTGPSRNVEALGKGADVLVSEVIDLDKMLANLKRAPDLPAAMLPDMVAHMRDDHLSPSEVGKMAAAMGVDEVVLTHLAPGADGEQDLAGYSRGIAPTFKGPVHVARDLERF